MALQLHGTAAADHHLSEFQLRLAESDRQASSARTAHPSPKGGHAADWERSVFRLCRNGPDLRLAQSRTPRPKSGSPDLDIHVYGAARAGHLSAVQLRLAQPAG